MIINKIINFSQNLLRPIYQNSYFLQKIDWLIFATIILIIFSSIWAPSDNIAYFAIFTIILTGVKILTKPNEKFELTKADKFLLLYFLFVLISVAGSTLFMHSVKGFFKTIVYLGFYVSFVHYLKDNISKLKYIFITFAFLAFVESILAIYQNFQAVSEISGWQDMSRLNPEQVMTRVYGSLKPLNPNLFGGYMLAILPANLILIFLPLINKHKKTALFGTACLILSLVTVVLTGCRGAYIGLFTELIALVLLTYHYLKPYYKKIFLYFCGLFALISSIVIVSLSSVRTRIFSIFAMRNDSSNSFRFNVYNSCLDMFKDNWLLGIGVGNQNFREIYGLYMKTGFDALSAYNIYLETAVESGIFALLAFLGFISYNMYLAIKYLLKRKNAHSIYIAIALLSIIGLLVHGLVDTVFFRPQIQFVFWIMVGIIRVITSRGKGVKG